MRHLSTVRLRVAVLRRGRAHILHCRCGPSRLLRTSTEGVSALLIRPSGGARDRSAAHPRRKASPTEEWAPGRLAGGRGGTHPCPWGGGGRACGGTSRPK